MKIRKGFGNKLGRSDYIEDWPWIVELDKPLIEFERLNGIKWCHQNNIVFNRIQHNKAAFMLEEHAVLFVMAFS